MESSEIFGGTEECNSCESGWTMYICSPIGSDDDDDGHSDKEDHSNDHEYDEGDDINYNHEVYSDDSMASDASSGPNNQGVTHFRLGEDDTESRCKSEKKVGKSMDNQRAESRRKNDKEKKVVVAKRSTTASAQTGPKIRRYNWIGKRK